MGYKNREIEAKLVVTSSHGYQDLLKALESFLDVYYPDYETISSKASDYYWNAPKQSNADFIRIRKQDSGRGGTITIKSTDKSDNLDRVEIDLDVSDFKQGLTLMTSLYGEARAKVQKKYHALFLENKHTNYSIYQITGDKRVFLEIEAKTVSRLIELVEKFTKFATSFSFNLVKSSIFEMFVEKTEPKIRNLEEIYIRFNKTNKR
jgi:adenylate cyclase class IV